MPDAKKEEPRKIAKTLPGDEPLGRPPVLDPAKRRQVLAMLASGSSRRAAARMVGCSASTITRTILRDEEFAEQALRAEQSLEVVALRRLRSAMQQDRYWRAAAWLLERTRPEDFARRPLKLLTQDQFVRAFHAIMERFFRRLSDEEYRRVAEDLRVEMHTYSLPEDQAPSAAQGGWMDETAAQGPIEITRPCAVCEYFDNKQVCATCPFNFVAPPPKPSETCNAP